jgi:hypothetical protein
MITTGEESANELTRNWEASNGGLEAQHNKVLEIPAFLQELCYETIISAKHMRVMNQCA